LSYLLGLSDMRSAGRMKVSSRRVVVRS
jgi:hypothetical protein